MPSEHGYNGRPSRSAAARSTRRKKKVRLKKRAYVVFALLIILICAAVFFINHAGVRFSVTAEAGGPVPGLEAFVKGDPAKYTLATDLSKVDMNKPGKTGVTIKGSLFPCSSVLEVKDTIPPRGEVKDMRGAVGIEIPAESFFDEISDATNVTVSFKTAPNFKSAGTQSVELLLKDAAGNTSSYTASLELVDDREAPVIEGVKNRTVYIGETIAYKAGVTVTDNMDPEPKLTIDNSQVDLDKVGVYPVTYTATDFSGNMAKITINLKVEEQPIGYANIEKMNQKVDALLAQIIKPEMTDIEKLYACFIWIREHIDYQNAHAQFDYVNEAIKCLDGRPGDCYTCAAGFRALAEAMGFEIKDVVGTYANRHYWVMVKLGNDWYHVDAVPLYVRTYVCFLGTDAELDAFMKLRPNYYNREKDKYPATPKDTPVHVEYKNGKYVLTYK
ncbi:MAG: transglutaminase domain-containing protein [Firmicutes bacterium]|nr:transglutaminase domain-containing protein [Bacillota bacterium]